MKVIPFTIPVAKENSVIVQEDIMPYFYSHLHRHNEIQITWVISGEGTLIIGNYMQPFKEGDMYVIGANLPHLFKSESAYFKKRSNKQIHSLNIFFNPNGFLQPILDLPEIRGIKNFVGSTGYGLQAPINKQKIISTEMLTIKNSLQGFRFASFMRLLQIFANIKDWKKLASIPSESYFSDTEGLRMNNIYQFTMTKFAENITLKQVAAIACLTPHSFCRYFKKYTQKTYIDFLNEIRINEACKKIVAGSFDSVKSIAYETGFNNAVSFNRVFRKVTGMAPLQYQKEFRGKLY